MSALTNQDAEALRAAIAWALHLADSQGQTLISALLANVLDAAELVVMDDL